MKAAVEYDKTVSIGYFSEFESIRRILFYKSLNIKAIHKQRMETKNGKKYKAVAITVPNKNTSDEFVAAENETRYVIKDMESGSIVDDAQGYGYRTAQKAYAGWSYKNRNKSKDKEKAEKENIIAKWMKDNKSFINLLDTLAHTYRS